MEVPIKLAGIYYSEIKGALRNIGGDGCDAAAPILI